MTVLPPIEIDANTFFRKHFSLPALPSVVGKIQQLIASGNADMERVSDLISSEPALMAQVLKVANSAYYGLMQEVTNVKYATAFLGLNEIHRMVLSLSVVNTLAIEAKDELNKFWFHSFYTALCTKYLANKYERHLSFEDLWSAAILHDIGKLVYLKFFPDHYKALVGFVKEEGGLFSAAETHLSLPSSSLFGTLLCDHWRLPDHVKAACESHELTALQKIHGDDPSARFQRMICIGNLLTLLSGGELNENTKNEIASAAMSFLDCAEPEFLTMMGDIYELQIEVERFTAQFH
jgi:HD-like signal output (HDOD) protein